MSLMPTDRAAVVAFHLEFGPEVRRIVDFIAGRRRLQVGDEDIDDLTFDACLAIADVASGWRADGGALPWNWARRRIEGIVASQIGPAVRRLPRDYDVEDIISLAPVDDVDVSTALARLAERDDRCALLLTALDEELSPVDAEVWLRYRVQQQSGDPAPAATVGRQLGLRPPAVRQRASRARRRLAAAVLRDERFRALTGLALLDPPARSHEVAA
jgi:DNA-directed RNA polymerase specialized sigma24 family protein